MKPQIGIEARTGGYGSADVFARVEPRLHGWIPAVIAPVIVVAVVFLLEYAPAGGAKFGALIFTGSMALNCTASAVLHRGRWAPGVERILTRLDHATIFLVIAAAYTSIATVLLHGEERATVLVLVWTGAALGIASRLIWGYPPRGLRVAAYLVLAAVPMLFLDDFTRQARPEVLALLGSAATLYLTGALVYAARRPNPVPRWYGFHEVFHTLVILGFVVHSAALAVAAPSLVLAMAG